MRAGVRPETAIVIQVDTGGAELIAGDGILLIGDTLYVSRNSFGQIAPVTMSGDYSTGTAGAAITDPPLNAPLSNPFPGTQ
jgi:hypothetical protein